MQPALWRKQGTATVPSMIRAISVSSGAVSSSLTIVNAGERPEGLRSARFASPSALNAVSRMCSIGPVSDARLATVKSQARSRFRRGIFALASDLKTRSIAGRRRSTAAEPVIRRSR